MFAQGRAESERSGRVVTPSVVVCLADPEEIGWLRRLFAANGWSFVSVMDDVAAFASSAALVITDDLAEIAAYHISGGQAPIIAIITEDTAARDQAHLNGAQTVIPRPISAFDFLGLGLNISLRVFEQGISV